jgi:predicted  nucleic acid-binding Zn-ribbon protein
MLNEPLIVLIAVAAFIVGWLAAKIGAYISARTSGQRQEKNNHQIRALEANLRIASKGAEEANARLESQNTELATTRKELEAAQFLLQEREKALQEAKANLGEECAKTADLRQELTHRATETIRAQVQLKEIQTEFSLARVGSDAVMEEVSRLEAERAELTSQLKILELELLNAENNEEPRRQLRSAAGSILDG